MAENRILIVDDDKNICELVRLYLEKDGYMTDIAYDGRQALDIFIANPPMAVILDIMLPVVDGIEVLKEIRRMGNIPVIMLTAKGETFDKVLGLELGADDYIVKPFEPKELVARVKAVMRRFEVKTNNNREVIYPNLNVNLNTYELKIGGNIVEIPPKELELLYFLSSNPNKVFTRDQLLDEVWGYDFYGDSRTVDVHINRLREKLAGYEDVWQVKTVWRVGYKFEVNPKWANAKVY